MRLGPLLEENFTDQISEFKNAMPLLYRMILALCKSTVKLSNQKEHTFWNAELYMSDSVGGHVIETTASMERARSPFLQHAGRGHTFLLGYLVNQMQPQ